MRPPEIELHHYPLRRQPVALDDSANPPEQQDRVQMHRLRLIERPARAPRNEGGGERLEVDSRLSQAILHLPLASADAPLDDAVALQLPQALAEERAGNAGEATGEVVEAAGTAQHVPHDQ